MSPSHDLDPFHSFFAGGRGQLVTQNVGIASIGSEFTRPHCTKKLDCGNLVLFTGNRPVTKTTCTNRKQPMTSLSTVEQTTCNVPVTIRLAAPLISFTDDFLICFELVISACNTCCPTRFTCRLLAPAPQTRRYPPRPFQRHKQVVFKNIKSSCSVT